MFNFLKCSSAYSIYNLSCCSFEGHKSAIMYVRVEAGVIPGSPFTLHTKRDVCMQDFMLDITGKIYQLVDIVFLDTSAWLFNWYPFLGMLALGTSILDKYLMLQSMFPQEMALQHPKNCVLQFEGDIWSWLLLSKWNKQTDKHTQTFTDFYRWLLGKTKFE